MNAELRRLVWDRAASQCEYCHLPQGAVNNTLHVEHIISRQHHGATVAENLALSCDRCNLYKGPNLAAIEPVTSAVVMLFHPRNDNWDEHFEMLGYVVNGLTPVGRATAQLLNMNAPDRLNVRAGLAARDPFSPES